ncbi:hypothetical protein CVT26_014868 [Gymnopilus dilepis]|uniref:Uncharacterized protein n=1 Tax=Gymnopilus dilepis TaxID=231916 RepID=A0A409XX38_9AGAR|nr:hypothetical protein CVT26_014868 [Gymnopilus dilepis]
MEANLDSLLEHNNPPSPSIRDAVKGFMTEPLKELGKKDVEIQDVVHSIEELEDQCDGLTKALKEYSPILSPIRQMPAEIIQDIFYYCLPSHRNPVMSNSEAPLLLMCVCKSWRSIALSSPRLWSKLHIPMPFFRVWSTALPQAPSWAYQQPHVVADQREAEERYRRIMSQRRQIVESWLSRSGTCPLSISLSFSSETLFPGDLRSTDDGNDLVQIFTSIFSAQRLEDLEISAPFEVYEALESKISVNDIHILKRLRLSFSSSLFTPHPSPPRKQVVLLQAPALQQVSIVAESVHLLDPTSALLTWTNLTHLSSHYVTESDAVRILRRCRNLEHCTLDIASTSTIELDLQDVILLPHLNFLSLRLSGRDNMEGLYRKLHVPSLRWFDYHSYNPSYIDVANALGDPAELPEIHPLFQSSSEVTTFSFDPQILYQEEVAQCFRSASQLTHIILGQRPRFPVSSYDFVTWAPLDARAGVFDLDALIIEPESLENEFSRMSSHSDWLSSTTTKTKEILLPELEVFEMYLKPNRLSDQTLKRFILSRLGKTAVRNGVKSLQRVKVVFGRDMDEDIEPEIRRRAEEDGTPIELDLRYIKPLSDHIHGGHTYPWVEPWHV